MAKDSQEYEDLYKMVLIGDATVGKTCLLSRYMKGEMPKASHATIGVEFATRTVQVASGKVVKVQIWDTAGQERYRAITSAHYRNAAGALLVYDVTNLDSFNNCEKWLADVRNGAGPNVLIELVGNKVDLVEGSKASDRKVPLDNASEFAQQHGLRSMEASAASGQNVDQIFQHLIQEIHDRNPSAQQNAAGVKMKINAVTPGSLAPTCDGSKC
mmetsp:Transcript_96413/g.152490  ORF Transcript_96413/g.152490 Transcript_96413/m.152490 type:complete len:214 (-) Transcript_96413:38-679(-)